MIIVAVWIIPVIGLLAEKYPHLSPYRLIFISNKTLPFWEGLCLSTED